MKKYFEILKKCPLFGGIDESELLSMLSCLKADVEVFDKKYTVISEGSPAKYVGIVLSGSIQVERSDYFGNRSILSKIGPSGVFGEAFACADIPSIPISVIADEQSEIMLIDCNRIINTCASSCNFHRRLIFNMMKLLAVKNIMFHSKLEITSKRSTREKLMTYLLQYAKNVGSSDFDIPFDRQELADYLEVERSGLSAEISKLRKEGIIKSHKKHFTIL